MKMTILAFEQWLNAENSSLFANISLPAGIDKSILINTIMLQCAEFGVLYTDPYFMQYQTTKFFDKNYHTFEEWMKGIAATYNPIENYDRYEDWTDTGAKNSTDTMQDSTSGSDSSGGTDGKTSSYDVTTDNSGTYKKKDQTTESGSYSNSSTSSSSRDASNTSVEDTSAIHSGHIHGNIGVTSSAQLLSEFYKISAWNIYDHIADMYCKDFCYGLYK